MSCPAPTKSTHPLTEEHLVAYGVPQDTIDDGKKVGLNWQQIVTLLLQFGLPALQAFIQSLLSQTKPVVKA